MHVVSNAQLVWYRQQEGVGFRAAALSSDGGPGKLLNKFDREVEQTLFVPHLQGG